MEQARAEKAAAYSYRVAEQSLRDILRKKAYALAATAKSEPDVPDSEMHANRGFYKKLLCQKAQLQSSLDEQRRCNIRAREQAMGRRFQAKQQTFLLTTLETAGGEALEVFTNGLKSYHSGNEARNITQAGGASLILTPLNYPCFDALKDAISGNTGSLDQGKRVEYHLYQGRLRPFIFIENTVLWCNTAEPFNQIRSVRVDAGEAGEAVLECTNVFPDVFCEIERACRQLYHDKCLHEQRYQRIRSSSEQAIARTRIETKRYQAVAERNQNLVQDYIYRYTRLKATRRSVSYEQEQKAYRAVEKQQAQIAERRQLRKEALAIEQRRRQQIEGRQNQLELQAYQLKQRLSEQKEREQYTRLGAKARRMQFMRHREAYKQQKRAEYAEQQENDLALLETRDNNIKEYERLRNKELLVKYKKA